VFASGASFLIKRTWLQKLGYLFDPYYFSYAEDIELSLRTVLLGGKIGYVRDSRIYHYIGGTGLSSGKKASYSACNLLLTYYKLLHLNSFSRLLVVRTIYMVARFLVRGQQLASNLGVVKGTLRFIATFPFYNRYRRVFAKLRKRDDKYIFERFLYKRRIEKALLEKGLYACSR
jgi:GT2 family glycosyltransferase